MDRHLVKSLQPIARRTRCTFVDSCLKHARPTMVLGYPERLDPSRMRRALERVLGDFGAFAGRLKHSQGDWYIEHGVGALFEIAKSDFRNKTIEVALRTGATKFIRPHLPMVGSTLGKDPLFAARLTQTLDGSVLGLTWNHALGDNHSMMLLLRAWALAARDQPYKAPLEVADREAYLNEHVTHVTTDASGGARWRVLSWTEFRDFVFQQARLAVEAKRVAIDFSWSQIAAIHAAASSKHAVSPGDALCAHIFWTLNALGNNVSSHYGLAYNIRKPLGLPAGLVGNLSDLVTVTAKPGDDPATIAGSLRDAIQAFNAASLTQRKLKQLKSEHPSILDGMRFWGGPAEPGRINLHLSNVSRAGHHKLVFDSARPTFAHTRSSDIPIVGVGMIFPSSHETGLTMDIVLPADVIKQLAHERTWDLNGQSPLGLAAV